MEAGFGSSWGGIKEGHLVLIDSRSATAEMMLYGYGDGGLTVKGWQLALDDFELAKTLKPNDLASTEAGSESINCGNLMKRAVPGKELGLRELVMARCKSGSIRVNNVSWFLGQPDWEGIKEVHLVGAELVRSKPVKGEVVRELVINCLGRRCKGSLSIENVEICKEKGLYCGLRVGGV
nr:hypothetical protein Iba_chr12eCG4880 [Ipomoea batatas]